MKLCRFQQGENRRLGCVSEKVAGKLVDISDVANGCTDLASHYKNEVGRRRVEQFLTEAEADPDRLTDQQSVCFLPPVERPGKIVCLAGNYRAHIAESGYVEPEARANFTQQLFFKTFEFNARRRRRYRIGKSKSPRRLGN